MSLPGVLSRLPLLLIVSALLPVSALAQSGRIVGAIFDSSGAVIPGVTVAAVNNATNVKAEFVTDATGNYDFPGLTVGRYTVRAALAGFKSAEARVLVEVAQTVRQNLTLVVGNVQEVVTVSGERGPVLQTESAEIGQVVTNREIVGLPLNGRSFIQLITLGTGAVQWGRQPPLVHINGARPGKEQYLIDGVAVGAPSGGHARVSPSVESIQEFKLQSSNFAAEYGRAPGLINVTTKSGGNAFRGGLYDFWRNDYLAANDFFVNQQKNPQKPRLNRHQFGGTLGGRIIRDKTFFFANYEGQRMIQAQTTTFRAPTDRERAGDFSQSPGVAAVLDPLTFQPFPGKVVPPQRIHPVYKYFADWFPGPNDASGLFNIVSSIATTGASPGVDNKVSGRVDHQFSSADKIYGRYFFNRGRSRSPGYGSRPGLMGLINTNMNPRSRQAVAHWDHIFSPRLVLDFQYAHVRWSELNRDFQTGFPEDGITNHVVASGIAGMEFTSQLYPGVPSLQFGNNFPTLGVNVLSPIRQFFNTHGYKAGLSWMKGRHAVKTGLDFLFQSAEAYSPLGPNRGLFQFAGLTTGGQNSWADFVLGVPAGALRTVPNTRTGAARNSYSYFVQDEIKLSPRLTLNVGVRYDYNTPATPLYGGGVVDISTGKIVFSDIDGTGQPNPRFSPGLPIMMPLLQGNLVSSSQLGLPPSFVHTPKKNFAPRVGMAWRPWGNKTVIRAGYGIYYLLDTVGFTAVNTSQQPPFSIQQSAPSNVANLNARRPLLLIEQMFQPFEQTKQIAASGWSALSINPNFPNPYENQFSLSVQREITSSLVVETAYVGKSAIHLSGTRLRALPANRPSSVPATTTYLSAEGTSNYNSLQVRAEKRYSHGLAFLASYTWSKTMDSGTGLFSGEVIGNLTSRRGPADFDIPHRLVLSLVYDLPFGSGRKWLSGKPAWVENILGGWQLSLINQFQSGHPFDLRWLGGNTTVATNPISSVPDRICSGKLNNPTPENWFDASCFVAHRKPADTNNPGTFLPEEGNAGRGILRADGITNWDIGLMKNFHFGREGRYRLQFRAEMFNAFNHVTFNAPSSTSDYGGGTVNLGTPTATKVINQWNSPRQIQFALKLNF